MGQSGSLVALGALLVLFGVLLALKAVLAGGGALLALAIALAVAHLAGAAGRWALGVAGVLAVLALPFLILKALGIALGFVGALLGLVFQLLPLALLALGGYLLYSAFVRR